LEGSGEAFSPPSGGVGGGLLGEGAEGGFPVGTYISEASFTHNSAAASLADGAANAALLLSTSIAAKTSRLRFFIYGHSFKRITFVLLRIA